MHADTLIKRGNLTLLKLYRYGGTWIKVDRTREQQTLDLHMGVPWETVTLTAFGRNRQLYYDILEEGMVQLPQNVNQFMALFLKHIYIIIN